MSEIIQVDHTIIIGLLGLVVIGAPVLLLAVLGVASLIDRKLGEDHTGKLCQGTIIVGLLAAVAVLALMLLHGTRHEAIELGNWVAISDYHFSVKLVFDRLSVPFAILSFILCGTIGSFATRYMHREHGYHRFFVLYALFVLGMVLTSLAGTIETLFAGWEFVGLSSALLVAYYQERAAPVRNGLRVWIVYRVSDAALLLAAIVLHHLAGMGDFDKLLGEGPWPGGHAAIFGVQATVVGLLLVFAAAGKSALVPFSGWLPRAMEGPTPSSAVFYGALSVHLGAFLLLRVSPLIETSAVLSGVVLTVGLTTAVYAYVAGSVQTDIKSAVSFASLVQVGLIVAEIGVISVFAPGTGMWLWYLPLVHLLGNACLRTLQFIRTPTLIQDYHALENAIGNRLPRGRGPFTMAPGRLRTWLYRFSLERGYLDSFLTAFIVSPFVRLFRWCDARERDWTDLLAGSSSRESDQVRPSPRAVEELLSFQHIGILSLEFHVDKLSRPLL